MKRSDTFEQILDKRIQRRGFLKTVAAVSVPTLMAPPARAAAADQLEFQAIAPDTSDQVLVPPGYSQQVVIRWGDAVMPGAAPFDLSRQTPEAQARQFGFNNDYLGFFPFSGFPFRMSSQSVPRLDMLRSSTWGILVANHEYTDGPTMFPGYNAAAPTRNEVDVELAAHGLSFVELWRRDSGWGYDVNSPFNRRITGETECQITGPAAGHEWMRTTTDRTGTRVRGTLNNCGGGKTPWGTVLTAEENFNQYFANNNALSDQDARRSSHARYGLPAGASERKWELYHDRFDIAKEPNEAFRFGWVVEIDPYNPTDVPKKRTALGRTKHEAATSVVARNGRVVVYSGDDERFEYVYKFVTDGRFNPGNRAANMNLLDSGTLYVARFRDDGTGQWLPMIGGQGPLANWTQAEICINTRQAADLLGATRMDRPEDIEVNPVNGKVYAIMTNNNQRGATGRPGPDSANPRVNNRFGHILEITEGGNDPTALVFRWEIFMLCGNPRNAADNTYFAGFDRSRVSLISTPDNLVFDNRGNMWIATDGQPSSVQVNDGIFAVPVIGEDRGYVRQLLSAPVAAEVCGPEFTPNNETLFVAIQHPGEGGTLASPTSRWPDGAFARSSVVAVSRTVSGRVIGS